MFIQSRFRFLPALLTIFVMLCSTASISATGDYRHYLPGGSVMVETIQQGTGAGAGAGSGSDTGSGSSTTGTKVLYYGYQDHLGSLTALVRERINGNGSIGRIVADYRSYDAWGRLRDNDDWTLPRTTDLQITDRGYTGHEHLQSFGIINMNGRVYDPLTAQFFSPDPYVQAPGLWLNYNRYAYCLNNPLIYTDPDGEFIFTALLPGVGVFLDAMCWGAVIGGAFGGIRGWMTEDMNFWDGAWRGAIVGAVGGLLSPVGGAGMSFGWNLALGSLEGAATGALDASLWGESIAKGALIGAATGAVFATLTSEQFSNWSRGKGFVSNEAVFENFKSGKYDVSGYDSWQDAVLDYFGFEGKYEPNNKLFNSEKGRSSEALTDMYTGKIYFNDASFSKDFDNLQFNAIHESIHRKHVLYGKYSTIDPEKMSKADYMKLFGEEEFQTYMLNYKNQGLYKFSKNGERLSSRIVFYGRQAERYDVEDIFREKWWHFIYIIPRRW